MELFSGLHHFCPVQTHVFRLRHDQQVGRIVVVLVAVDVMDDLISSQRPAKHLLSNHSMLMPPVQLAVSGWFDFCETLNLRFAIALATFRFWGDVARIAIAAHSLGVLAAHPTRTLLGRIGAAINAALLSHQPGKQFPATVGECRQL